MKPALLVAALLFQLASKWRDQPAGTGADLYAVRALSTDVCFAAGAKGTWARTVDGGHTWYAHWAPGAGKLDFRCIAVLSPTNAFFLNVGKPARLYRTTTGTSAKSVYENDTDGIRFFGLAFWDERHGIMLADPIGDRRFLVVTTFDGGATWQEPPRGEMPSALPGEMGLAAGGTALAVQSPLRAWFGTGGASRPRVYRTTDGGGTWAVSDVPLPASPTGGIRSLAFADGSRGLAIAGDDHDVNAASPDVARTTDGGVTWSVAGRTKPTGLKESIAIVPGTSGPSCVAAGPTGTSYSTDFGTTWRWLDKSAFHAVSFAGAQNAGWGVGDGGKISKLQTGVVSGMGSTKREAPGKVLVTNQ